MARRIAIVGSGYSAVGIAHHLRSLAGASVTVIDQGPAGGGGASVASAGLMHPISPRGKMSWRGEESYAEALQIMSRVSSFTSSFAPNKCDIKYPFFGDTKTKFMKDATSNFPDWVELLEDDAIKRYNESMKTKSDVIGVLKNGIFIDSSLYLQAFWALMKAEHQFEFIHKKIESIEEIAPFYDIVFLAVGAGLLSLWREALPLLLIRGRNVVYDTRLLSAVPSFDVIMSGKYAIHHPNSCELVCGSTYEYAVSAETDLYQGDVASAEGLLTGKLHELLPQLAAESPVRCTVGIRVSAHDAMVNGVPKLPLVLQDSEFKNVWAVTGMGSKGLLYHGLVGKYAAEAAINCNIDCVPNELVLRTNNDNNRQ
jgi:glycine/D-amino acid oxidase-like deaminating enzyme